MEVAEQNGGLGARDEQNDKHQEQEAKHVVHLVGPNKCNIFDAAFPFFKRGEDSCCACLPNAVEDEEELDEDAAKGQDATHDISCVIP